MKKNIILSCLISCMLCGCSEIESNQTSTPTSNRAIITSDHYFNKAMIKMANGAIITVDVKQYKAGESSVIIYTEDGAKYGVAYTDVTFYVE